MNSCKNPEILQQWVKERRIQPSHDMFNPILRQWINAKDVEEVKEMSISGTAQLQRAWLCTSCGVLSWQRGASRSAAG